MLKLKLDIVLRFLYVLFNIFLCFFLNICLRSCFYMFIFVFLVVLNDFKY